LAGVNKSLKAGDVVFKTGDDADGMYVVRRGELVVYLEQDNKEIVLARIPEGGIVGEMALFEKMPRSASVKAGVDSEITHISQADFAALMKQIPKWFVGLMGALSSRLRTTNDRLKSLENPGQADRGGLAASQRRPFMNSIRVLHTIDLVLQRDASRDGKEVSISRKSLEDQLVQVFGETPSRVASIIDALSSEAIFVSKQDSYKNVNLAVPNRAALTQFTQFLTNFTKNNPTIGSIPETSMNILKLVGKMAAKTPYETFTVTLEELSIEATATGIDPANFGQFIGTFVAYGEAVKTTKTSEKSGVGLRIVKAAVPALLRNLGTFSKLADRTLD